MALTRVLSLDPGKTTGYCTGRLVNNQVTLDPRQDELDHVSIYNLLADYSPHYVICEDFEYRPGQAKDYVVLVSLEYIGIVKLWNGEDDERKLSMQKASEGKGFYTNDKLRELGLYKRGVPHGMDALRHMMHWFTFKAGYGLTEGKAQYKLNGG